MSHNNVDKIIIVLFQFHQHRYRIISKCRTSHLLFTHTWDTNLAEWNEQRKSGATVEMGVARGPWSPIPKKKNLSNVLTFFIRTVHARRHLTVWLTEPYPPSCPCRVSDYVYGTSWLIRSRLPSKPVCAYSKPSSLHYLGYYLLPLSLPEYGQRTSGQFGHRGWLSTVYIYIVNLLLCIRNEPSFSNSKHKTSPITLGTAKSVDVDVVFYLLWISKQYWR